MLLREKLVVKAWECRNLLCFYVILASFSLAPFSFVTKPKSFPVLLIFFPFLLPVPTLVHITFGWLRFILNLDQVTSLDLWNFFFNKNGLDAVRNLVQGDRYSPLM